MPKVTVEPPASETFEPPALGTSETLVFESDDDLMSVNTKSSHLDEKTVE